MEPVSPLDLSRLTEAEFGTFKRLYARVDACDANCEQELLRTLEALRRRQLESSRRRRDPQRDYPRRERLVVEFEVRFVWPGLGPAKPGQGATAASLPLPSYPR